WIAVGGAPRDRTLRWSEKSRLRERRPLPPPARTPAVLRRGRQKGKECPSRNRGPRRRRRASPSRGWPGRMRRAAHGPRAWLGGTRRGDRGFACVRRCESGGRNGGSGVLQEPGSEECRGQGKEVSLEKRPVRFVRCGQLLEHLAKRST